ncbi:DUF2332 domain-containing protein [Nocardioides houyundeii]|uniref:DUF2332 domain-containing protein n=1 Tax=Nocardioides houyundeii TaxID=2045452 RepID=UPI000DF2AC3B|nr:DUF2332 domain-containing protein [Nocardioides houyundeii]
MLLHGDIAERYRDFADYARGDSPCFEEWALSVAQDPEVLSWLEDLPEAKQQPNLVFAAARRHGAAAPAPYAELRRVLLQHGTAVRRTVLACATQTNEVGRLATLVPVLAGLGEPLALVEVGASAGLCLFPDRYDYVWSGAGSLRTGVGPVLRAEATGPLPVPRRHPQVAWRGGCDLNPLDVQDADQMSWLETLVWPEQEERRRRLRAAIRIARAEPPRLQRGDLLDLLPSLVEEAGRHGLPVVFHSAVAAYLDADERDRFATLMAGLVAQRRCHWVSNEGPGVLPGVTATGPATGPPAGRFVLGLDGRAVAWTHGHGHAIEWVRVRSGVLSEGPDTLT